MQYNFHNFLLDLGNKRKKERVDIEEYETNIVNSVREYLLGGGGHNYSRAVIFCRTMMMA